MSWYVILWNNIWLFGSSRGSTLPLLILGDRDICNSPYIFESVQCFFSFVAQLFVSRGFFSGALCTGSSTLIKEISLLSGFAIFGDQSIYCITSLHLLTQLPFGESDYLLSTLVVFRGLEWFKPEARGDCGLLINARSQSLLKALHVFQAREPVDPFDQDGIKPWKAMKTNRWN